MSYSEDKRHLAHGLPFDSLATRAHLSAALVRLQRQEDVERMNASSS